MENTADKFIDKHNNGNDFIPDISNHFYIYRLREEGGSTKTFEIGYVENPKKGITYTWDDVRTRVCEGFWGDKVMVEKVVRLLNGC